MKYRIEILIPLLTLGYVAYFPLASGELMNYFFKTNILVPFILVFIGLNILTFGIEQFFQLLKSAKYFLITEKPETLLKQQTINGAISFSYVSSILWILYILVISSAYKISSEYLVSGIALALTYAFILSELILRPLKIRLAFIKS